MVSRPLRTAVFTGLLIVLGCEVTGARSSDPDFGDPYALLTEDPATAPRLDAERLHATVQYSGGCKTHTFDLHFRVRGTTTEIWLDHDARGDMCEAYNTLPLSLAVSRRALETPDVVLLLPDGSAFTLR